MKRTLLIFLLLLLMHQSYAYCPTCSIIIQSQWHELSSRHHTEKQVIVGTLTFKKKIKNPVKLEKITLQWHGTPINQLCGSLYTQRPSKPFKAIEENLLCDSNWHNRTQQISFLLDKKKTLDAIETLYLVLAIPHHLEPLLKNGYFTIIGKDLPDPFAQTTLNQQLIIQSPPSILTK